MGGHIVGAFVIVLKVRGVFGDGLIKKSFKIAPYRWICILVDCEAGGGMLDENVKYTGFNAL